MPSSRKIGRPFVADIRRYLDSRKQAGNFAVLTALCSRPGLQALLAYRLGRYLLRCHSKWYRWPILPVGWPLYYLLSRCVRACYDIRLCLSADIGPGLQIIHFGNILLRDCVLGEGCAIRQSVHVTPLAGGAGPVVGEKVFIGVHSKVIGSFRIGDGCTLGPGTVICRDLPESTLCLGNPGRALGRGYDNSFLHRTAIET